MKKALITGVTGQDGMYLTQLLLDKGYHVFGLIRRTSLENTGRIEKFLNNDNFDLLPGDMGDTSSIFRILDKVRPDEIYNLAAQSFVGESFETPEYTANIDGVGTLRILEAIKTLKLIDARFYQASTSELYGLVQETPQTEKTAFYPRSPYAIAKLYAYWITVNYRESYGIYACNGILFNHESPVRGKQFVTRKIACGVSDYIKRKKSPILIGNLDSRRDWGHAKDYVDAMWRILQQDKPEDFVIATGETHSVREFIEESFGVVGVSLEWKGTGSDEIGVNIKTGEVLVKVDPMFFRPAEVDILLGDSSKALCQLGWKSAVSFKGLVREMVEEELNQ
jgi:GDPmannose 4,6-dehydratase